MHHWKETGEVNPPWASAADVSLLERKLEATGVRRESYWRPGVGHHEVTFAINLLTRQLEVCETRALADDFKAAFDARVWLTGTIDWYAPAPTCTHWIDDLKTGRWPVNPATSRQLRSYALYSYLRNQMDPKWHCKLSITQWPKYPIDGLPQRKVAPRPMTALDAEEHLDDLRYVVEHPGETNPTEEGCKFCDSRPVCPAWAL